MTRLCPQPRHCEKRHSFFEFSPCLSRACLGKKIVLHTNGAKVAFCAPEIDPDVGLCPRATLRGSLNLNRVRHVADVHEVILWGDLILVLTAAAAAAAAAAFRRDHRRLLVHIHHRHTCMKDTYRHVYAWTRTRTTTRAQPHAHNHTGAQLQYDDTFIRHMCRECGRGGHASQLVEDTLLVTTAQSSTRTCIA
jgi:hypothetical protein